MLLCDLPSFHDPSPVPNGPWDTTRRTVSLGCRSEHQSQPETEAGRGHGHKNHGVDVPIPFWLLIWEPLRLRDHLIGYNKGWSWKKVEIRLWWGRRIRDFSTPRAVLHRGRPLLFPATGAATAHSLTVVWNCDGDAEFWRMGGLGMPSSSTRAPMLFLQTPHAEAGINLTHWPLVRTRVAHPDTKPIIQESRRHAIAQHYHDRLHHLSWSVAQLVCLAFCWSVFLWSVWSAARDGLSSIVRLTPDCDCRAYTSWSPWPWQLRSKNSSRSVRREPCLYSFFLSGQNFWPGMNNSQPINLDRQLNPEYAKLSTGQRDTAHSPVQWPVQLFRLRSKSGTASRPGSWQPLGLQHLITRGTSPAPSHIDPPLINPGARQGHHTPPLLLRSIVEEVRWEARSGAAYYLQTISSPFRQWFVVHDHGIGRTRAEALPCLATPKYPRHTEATVLLIVCNTTELTGGSEMRGRRGEEVKRAGGVIHVAGAAADDTIDVKSRDNDTKQLIKGRQILATESSANKISCQRDGEYRKLVGCFVRIQKNKIWCGYDGVLIASRHVNDM